MPAPEVGDLPRARLADPDVALMLAGSRRALADAYRLLALRYAGPVVPVPPAEPGR